MTMTFDEICIDATDPTALGRWWSQALGWPHDIDEDGDVRLSAPPGAGPDWSYREPGTGETYARSEGLGVASFHMFANGLFSRDAKGDPLRVDAERLIALTPMDVALGFR